MLTGDGQGHVLPTEEVKSDDDDDCPRLSAETLLALQEFRQEQSLSSKQLDSESPASSMPAEVPEDWQLSQFWYDDATGDILAREALRAAGSGGRIACVSCPTVYRHLRAIIDASDEAGTDLRLTLFEYDRRFASYGSDFVFYDYRQPTAEGVMRFRSGFDVVVADPPFLSEECLAKTAETVRLIAKDKIVVCTGATMEETVSSLLGLMTCTFRPGHARNLANEFRCYANYDLDSHVSEPS